MTDDKPTHGNIDYDGEDQMMIGRKTDYPGDFVPPPGLDGGAVQQLSDRLKKVERERGIYSRRYHAAKTKLRHCKTDYDAVRCVVDEMVERVRELEAELVVVEREGDHMLARANALQAERDAAEEEMHRNAFDVGVLESKLAKARREAERWHKVALVMGNAVVVATGGRHAEFLDEEAMRVLDQALSGTLDPDPE